MIAYYESTRGGQLRGVVEHKGCKAVQVRWGNPTTASVYAITCSDAMQGRAVLRQMGVTGLDDEPTRLSPESEHLAARVLGGDVDALELLRDGEWYG